MLLRHELEAMLQICLILFIVCMFSSFCTSNLFTLVDNEIMKIENMEVRVFSLVASLFCQLVVTAIVYLFIDTFLFKIKSVSHKNMSIGELHAAEYCIHIVLILILIEMNSSLMFEIEYVRNYITLVPKFQKTINITP
jgi:hypothetical protein